MNSKGIPAELAKSGLILVDRKGMTRLNVEAEDIEIIDPLISEK